MRSPVQVIVGAVAVVAVLGGGATSTADARIAVAHIESAQTAYPPNVAAYLATMHALDVGRYYTGQTDASDIEAGKTLCANEVSHGLTWVSLAKELKTYGMSDYLPFYRVYVQASVVTFCPEYLPIAQG